MAEPSTPGFVLFAQYEAVSTFPIDVSAELVSMCISFDTKRWPKQRLVHSGMAEAMETVVHHPPAGHVGNPDGGTAVAVKKSQIKACVLAMPQPEGLAARRQACATPRLQQCCLRAGGALLRAPQQRCRTARSVLLTSGLEGSIARKVLVEQLFRSLLCKSHLSCAQTSATQEPRCQGSCQ